MIVGMVPTYREGILAADAITSLLPIADVVLVYEGPISGAPSDGIDTDFKQFKKNQKVIVKHGEWDSEVHKRNSMLDQTRRYPAPTWGIFLDADEVLLWGEYVASYIEHCDSQSPDGRVNVACPILRVEEDGSTQKLTRIIRLDMLEKHLLASSQWKFFSSDIAVTFPAEPFDRAPWQGEPHVLHRPYLRPKSRHGFRLSDIESADFTKMEKAIAEPLGMEAKGAIPKVIDRPELIIAQDSGQVEQAAKTLGIEVPDESRKTP